LVKCLAKVATTSYFVTFPLILTFSRREKEQPLTGFLKSESLQAESSFRFAKNAGSVSPSPSGRGLG
jgi:hypothetical protein